jgi:hypothetical protein
MELKAKTWTFECKDILSAILDMLYKQRVESFYVNKHIILLL